jgi:hypothetical protein
LALPTLRLDPQANDTGKVNLIEKGSMAPLPPQHRVLRVSAVGASERQRGAAGSGARLQNGLEIVARRNVKCREPTP